MCEHSSFPWSTTYPTVFLTERLLMLYTESRSRWEMDASTLRVRVETVDRAPGLLTQVNDQLRYSASKVQFENRNSTEFRQIPTSGWNLRRIRARKPLKISMMQRSSGRACCSRGRQRLHHD